MCNRHVVKLHRMSNAVGIHNVILFTKCILILDHSNHCILMVKTVVKLSSYIFHDTYE